MQQQRHIHHTVINKTELAEFRLFHRFHSSDQTWDVCGEYEESKNIWKATLSSRNSPGKSPRSDMKDICRLSCWIDHDSMMKGEQLSYTVKKIDVEAQIKKSNGS